MRRLTPYLDSNSLATGGRQQAFSEWRVLQPDLQARLARPDPRDGKLQAHLAAIMVPVPVPGSVQMDFLKHTVAIVRRVSSSLRHPAWEFTDYLPLDSRRMAPAY